MATTTYGTEYVQSSDLVSNWPGSSLSVANRIDDVSLKGNGLNNQTGTTYTLVLADGGKIVTLNNASAVSVTIPTNASVAFPTGVVIGFTNKGAGTVTLAGAGGVTVNGASLTLAQNESAEALKLDTNTWVINKAGASGKVLQVVSTAKTDTFTHTSTTFTDVTGLSLSITPTKTSSKIMIICQVSGSNDAAVVVQQLRLMRDSTAIGIGDAASNRVRATASLTNTDSDTNQHISVIMSFLDSPNTVSATTYKVQSVVNGVGTAFINRSDGDPDTTVSSRTISTITAWEISA